MSKLTTVFEARTSKANATASGLVQRALSSIRTVAAFGAQDRFLQDYSDALQGPASVAVFQCFFMGLAYSCVLAVIFFTYAAVFYFGAWRTSTGVYSGGQVVQVSLMISRHLIHYALLTYVSDRPGLDFEVMLTPSLHIPAFLVHL